MLLSPEFSPRALLISITSPHREDYSSIATFTLSKLHNHLGCSILLQLQAGYRKHLPTHPVQNWFPLFQFHFVLLLIRVFSEIMHGEQSRACAQLPDRVCPEPTGLRKAPRQGLSCKLWPVCSGPCREICLWLHLRPFWFQGPTPSPFF